MFNTYTEILPCLISTLKKNVDVIYYVFYYIHFCFQTMKIWNNIIIK